MCSFNSNRKEKLEWICFKCTYINYGSNSICEVCTNLKDFEQTKINIKPALNEWTCIKCTFINDGKCDKCEVCGYKIDQEDILLNTLDPKEPIKYRIFPNFISHEWKSLDGNNQRKAQVNKELKNKMRSLTSLYNSNNWKCIKCNSSNDSKNENCSYCFIKTVYKIHHRPIQCFFSIDPNPSNESTNDNWTCKCAHLNSNLSTDCVVCMKTPDKVNLKPVNNFDKNCLKCTYTNNKTSISIKIVGDWKCNCGFENQETDVCEVCGRKVI